MNELISNLSNDKRNLNKVKVSLVYTWRNEWKRKLLDARQLRLNDGIYAGTNIAVTNLNAYPNICSSECIFLLGGSSIINSTIWLLQQIFQGDKSKIVGIQKQPLRAR